MQKEEVAAYFKAIYWNLPGGTKGNNDISVSVVVFSGRDVNQAPTEVLALERICLVKILILGNDSVYSCAP
jgi:hypothetical protein